MSRTTLSNVYFARPFTLSAVEGTQSAGNYTVETEEELLDGLSFPAYRRLRTIILLPAKRGSMIVAQAAVIDPLELDATLAVCNAPSALAGD
jgi:hypothetical protein